MEKLLYIQSNGLRDQTILGYQTMKYLENYRGINARNKVVLKCDLSKPILRGAWLSEINMEVANGICCTLMAIDAPADLNDFSYWITHKLQILMKSDELFKRKLEELYHFKFKPQFCPNSNFFLVVTDAFRERYELVRTTFSSTTTAIGFQIIYEDGPEVWFAVDDVANNEILYDKQFEIEVVSNAKNWRRNIRCRE